MTDHPTAFWEAMQDGNVFYRRHQIYSIPGKLPNLSDFIVAGSRHGGPIGCGSLSSFALRVSSVSVIALMRDSTKLVTMNRVGPPFGKAQVQIYSPAAESLLIFSVAILFLC